MKKSHVSKWILGLLFALSVTQVSAAESAIKQQLAKEGFKFIKQIVNFIIKISKCYAPSLFIC